MCVDAAHQRQRDEASKEKYLERRSYFYLECATKHSSPQNLVLAKSCLFSTPSGRVGVGDSDGCRERAGLVFCTRRGSTNQLLEHSGRGPLKRIDE